jgi:hypothetical protein
MIKQPPGVKLEAILFHGYKNNLKVFLSMVLSQAFKIIPLEREKEGFPFVVVRFKYA